MVTLCLVLRNIFNNSKNETPDSIVLTALTIYILGCLVFSFIAMMYYGVILSLIRKPQKVKDADGSKIANAKIETSEEAFVVTD